MSVIVTFAAYLGLQTNTIRNIRIIYYVHNNLDLTYTTVQDTSNLLHSSKIINLEIKITANNYKVY